MIEQKQFEIDMLYMHATMDNKFLRRLIEDYVSLKDSQLDSKAERALEECTRLIRALRVKHEKDIAESEGKK